MPGIRRLGACLFGGLCAIALVALYAGWAQQFVRISGETIQHWVDGAGGGYAVLYAPMHGS
jgi:hypothetical protein